MASRGFDGKVALHLREGRGWLSTSVAPPRGHSPQPNEESRGRGERRKRNGRRGTELAEARERNTTSPLEPLGLGAGESKGRVGGLL